MRPSLPPASEYKEKHSLYTPYRFALLSFLTAPASVFEREHPPLPHEQRGRPFLRAQSGRSLQAGYGDLPGAIVPADVSRAAGEGIKVVLLFLSAVKLSTQASKQVSVERKKRNRTASFVDSVLGASNCINDLSCTFNHPCDMC